MRSIILISALFIVSCGQKKFDGEIKMLDSLRKEVVKVKEDFNALDSIRIHEMAVEVPAKLADLNKVYMPDSVNLTISTLVNTFNGYRGYPASFNLQRLRIKKEIPYCDSQLVHLITDLRNNSLKTEDAAKYVAVERKAATELCKTFIMLKNDATKKTLAYDSLNVLVNTLIDSLRSDSLNVQSIRLKLLKSRTKRR